MKDIDKEKLYTQNVKVYYESRLLEVLLVIYSGYAFVIKKDTHLLFQPFHILNDVSKFLYSDKYQCCLAMKMRDLRKLSGRDHLIIYTGKRQLLQDFMDQYAELEEDDIIFEANEEFSILVNQSPVWFSFEDVMRSDRQESKLISSDANVLTGFLELKENRAMNILRSLFQGDQACWERKYLVLDAKTLKAYAPSS